MEEYNLLNIQEAKIRKLKDKIKKQINKKYIIEKLGWKSVSGEKEMYIEEAIEFDNQNDAIKTWNHIFHQRFGQINTSDIKTYRMVCVILEGTK